MRRRFIAILLACLLLSLTVLPAYASSGSYDFDPSKEHRSLWKDDDMPVRMILSEGGFQFTFRDNAASENPTYKFKSYNPEVAMVDKSGWVTLTGIGEARIEVRSPSTEHYNPGMDVTVITVIPDEDNIDDFVIFEQSPYGTISWGRHQVSYPVSGETVFVETEPIEEYSLTEINVLDNEGLDLFITDVGSGCQFTLPEEDRLPVTVSAEFIRTILQEPPEHGIYKFMYGTKNLVPGSFNVICEIPDEGYGYGPVTITDAEGNKTYAEQVIDATGPTNMFKFHVPYALPMTVHVDMTKIPENFTVHNDGTIEPTTEPGQEPPEDKFFDVHEGSWFYEPVTWAVHNGITWGMGNASFLPHMICTRSQVFTMLWRSYGSPKPEGFILPFSDVPNNAYYRDAIQWALEHGIIPTGSGNTTIRPDDRCTRAEVAALICAAYNAFNKSEKAAWRQLYDDVPNSHPFSGAVIWASEHGVMNGVAPGKFEPDQPCTRAQLVTALYRAAKLD